MRKGLRTADRRVAQEPPRKTLESGPKKIADYSLYGKDSKPG